MIGFSFAFTFYSCRWAHPSFICFLMSFSVYWSYPGENVQQRLRGGHPHFPPGQSVTAPATHHSKETIQETAAQSVRQGGGALKAPLLCGGFKNRGLGGRHLTVYVFGHLLMKKSRRMSLLAPPCGFLTRWTASLKLKWLKWRHHPLSESWKRTSG